MQNDASREGYADNYEGASAIHEDPETRPRHAKAYQNPFVKAYQTPGPGPSANLIPASDLELSKVDKHVEDIRAILKRGNVRPGGEAESAIKFELSMIEKSVRNLRGD